MAISNREALHRAIDELPQEDLDELQVLITVLRHKRTHPGSAWLRTLYDLFEPVRAGAAHMSEEEINAVIDQAIDEARRGRNT